MKHVFTIEPKESDILHAAKGSQKTNHKYIARKIGRNGKWIYLYADQKGGNSMDRVRNAKEKAEKELHGHINYTNSLYDRSESARTSKKEREDLERNKIPQAERKWNNAEDRLRKYDDILKLGSKKAKQKRKRDLQLRRSYDVR